jgi:hypothetical protein
MLLAEALKATLADQKQLALLSPALLLNGGAGSPSPTLASKTAQGRESDKNALGRHH